MKARLLAAAVALSASFAIAAPAPKPAPTLPPQPPGSAAILLGLDRVRQELGLTSLQRAILNDIRADYRDGARTIAAKAAADPGQKSAAREQLATLTKKSNRRAVAVLNPTQRTAFEKIERRYLGVWALLDPEVQTELGLTPKQKTKLAHVWAHYQGAISDVNRAYEQGEISHNERITDLYSIRYDASDDLRERLTNAQRAKLAEIVGRPLP